MNLSCRAATVLSFATASLLLVTLARAEDPRAERPREERGERDPDRAAQRDRLRHAFAIYERVADDGRAVLHETLGDLATSRFRRGALVHLLVAQADGRPLYIGGDGGAIVEHERRTGGGIPSVEVAVEVTGAGTAAHPWRFHRLRADRAELGAEAEQKLEATLRHWLDDTAIEPARPTPPPFTVDDQHAAERRLDLGRRGEPRGDDTVHGTIAREVEQVTARLRERDAKGVFLAELGRQKVRGNAVLVHAVIERRDGSIAYLGDHEAFFLAGASHADRLAAVTIEAHLVKGGWTFGRLHVGDQPIDAGVLGALEHRVRRWLGDPSRR